MSTFLIMIIIGIAMFLLFAGLGGTIVKIALRLAGIALVILSILFIVL